MAILINGGTGLWVFQRQVRNSRELQGCAVQVGGKVLLKSAFQAGDLREGEDRVF